ncbi:uncharacterized protein LOC108481711 [Gossypium arboreum]|uniref:uncharacterized protein LOC108481711 n=1 Tax=Gossypium arboreum TaxID=29729 RepID=UPI00081903AE|nr:uncharacterized protein LOC108481711 [Gossypium arboreum]
MEDEEVTVIEEQRDYLSNVIFALRAEKLVRKGCKTFLAYVGISGSKGPFVRDVRTVKEFSDVFPKELPGLHPNCEVEFGIELLPGTAPPVKIPFWKWERLTMDFVICTDYSLQRLAKLYVAEIVRLWEDYFPLVEFSYNNSYQSSIQMALYKVLYGRRCRTPTCWIELGEWRVLGHELVSDTKGKRVGPIAYQLELPPEVDIIHDVFHVSMLRRYRLDPSHIVPVEEIEIRVDLTIEEEPVQILDRDINVLRRRFVLLVKVLWRNHGSEKATWEPGEAM